MTELEFLKHHDNHLFCKEGAPGLATPEEVIADWKVYFEFTDEFPIMSLDEYVATLRFVDKENIDER